MAEIAGVLAELDKAYARLIEVQAFSADTAIKPEEIGIKNRMTLNDLKRLHRDVRETEDVKVYIKHQEEKNADLFFILPFPKYSYSEQNRKSEGIGVRFYPKSCTAESYG